MFASVNNIGFAGGGERLMMIILAYSNLTKNNYSDYTQASREILPASNLGSLTVNPLRNKTSLPHNLGQESLAQEPLNEPQNIELIYSTKPNPNKRGKPTRQLSHSVHLPERPSHYRTADRNYFTRNSGHGNSGFVPTLGTSTYLGNNSRNRLHYQSKRIGKAFDIDSKINQSITDNLRKKSISTSNLTGGPANRNSSIKTFRDFKNRNKLHNCKSIAYQDCSDQNTNIFVEKTSDGEFIPRIADFGTARDVEQFKSLDKTKLSEIKLKKNMKK